jgi:hypothetical protein
MKRTGGKVECWSLCDPMQSPYRAPELGSRRLQGVVSGDANFPAHYHIVTSDVVKIDGEARTCETKNTIYQLGKIDPGYVAYMKAHGYIPTAFKIADFE